MTNNPHANGRVLQAGAPVAEAKLAIVLLHGRGSTAEDILGLGSAFDLADVAYFAPQAAGHSWYPLSFLAPRDANEPFLSSALLQVESLVNSIEAAGMPRKQIVIGGFSQGACLSTEFVATHPAQYGGLIAFTGGLIGPPGTIKAVPDASAVTALKGTPAFFGSGDPDPHVPWSRVVESAALLQAMGAEVEIRKYPGRPHTVTADEIATARSRVLDRHLR